MKLKLSPNLGLGFAELSFLQASLQESLLSDMVGKFGVVRKTESFDELKVVQGTANTVSINAGVAINSNLQRISIPQLENLLQIPGDGTDRYIVIRYRENTIEKGTVQVQADGTLTVESSDESHLVRFTKQLRGLGPIPSKIRFPNSSNNVSEYFVRSIISDQALLLNIGEGAIIPETNLKWQIVGSFTQGIVIEESDKNPFITDDYVIELRSTPNVIEGEEFILASVSFDNSNLTITDKRDDHRFMLNSYIFNI